MKFVKAENGVVYLKSDLLKSTHGFSTRIGGVSELDYTSSLNLAFNRGDSKSTVLENLNLFSSAVGFDPQELVSMKQVHSADVIVVDKKQCGESYFMAGSIECDGYVTGESGICLGIKTADCVPVLMEGYNGRGEILAVGAVHAGWRGTVNKIVVKCVEKVGELGVLPCNIKVAIGPAICQNCFEVKGDFYETVSKILSKDVADKYVIPSKINPDVFNADLKSMNIDFLCEIGVKRENIDVSLECTCCKPEFWYSHRYSKGKRGTHLSVIQMP